MSISCLKFNFTIAQNITEVSVWRFLSHSFLTKTSPLPVKSCKFWPMLFLLQRKTISSIFWDRGLFVVGFSSDLRIFHLYGDDVTITSEELKILTYDWHSWPLCTSCIYIFSLNLLKKTAVFHFLRHLITKAQKRDLKKP